MKQIIKNAWGKFQTLPLSVRASWIVVDAAIFGASTAFPVFMLIVFISIVICVSVLNIIDWRIDYNRRSNYWRKYDR